MKNYRISKLVPTYFKVLVILFLISASVSNAAPIKHIIAFGGSIGYNYSPNTLEVVMGDTIEWQGDFSSYDLVSVSVPSGAASFGPIKTGTTFDYVVQVPGMYSYKDEPYVTLGMAGTITVDTIHNGLSNEGREFYLAMIYPNYNTGANPFFFTYAMINTYYANEISISYFDELGKELPGKIYRVPAKGSLKVPLDRTAMRIDETVDAPAAKSCHITSKQPITVEYLSVGPCSGGSYLALPVIALGKNYVASCYTDNPGDGAFSNPTNAGGAFIVIGTVDGTTVQITPRTTTTFNHTGAKTGFGSDGNAQPYSITINKGQTYLVRSNGDDNGNDMSGSVIEANNPVGVIAGNENAFGLLGGVSPYAIEARDYLVEQMVPYELWDTAGFISIPLAEAQFPGDEGHGDTYRIYSYDDTSVAHVHLGIGSGGDDYFVRRYNFSEKNDVSQSTETYSTNGQKISVMQYDERSESKARPWPAPSMMTVVPRSHWKRFYSFNLLDNSNVWQVIDNPYINVISDHMDDIRVSINGGTPGPLTTLGKVSTFSNLSGSDVGLSGTQYKLNTPVLNPSAPYYLTSEYPFMVYFYEMRDAAQTGLGGNVSPNIPHEYAAPAGMMLNTGAEPKFVVTIDSTTNCSKWHICVHDTASNNPGIRSVMLVNDPDGVYFQPGRKLSNVSFDTTGTGYIMGEYHPQLLNPTDEFCFTVNVLDPLQSAVAPIAIIDNNGNADYFQLQYKAATLKLSTSPPTVSRADSIVFPVQSSGQQICTTFVVKNTAAAGGQSITITSISLQNGTSAFSLGSVAHLPPYTIAPQGSDTIQVCYNAVDTLRHRDSLLLQTSCFGFAISLDAHGGAGLILAEDMDFGYSSIYKEVCKDIQIRNVGSAPLKILSLTLSDTKDFAISAQTMSALPISIKPGGSAIVNVCFHPKQEGPYSEMLTYKTDQAAAFATSIKNYSYLNGTGAIVSSVKSDGVIADGEPLKIYPNPATGLSAVVNFPMATKLKSVISITDVLGRELYKKDIFIGVMQTEIPIGNLETGMYYVSLSSENGLISQKMEVVR